jgi:hypothetical protein
MRCFVDLPRCSSGRLARYEEYDNRFSRRDGKTSGRSRTTKIPSEFGPNASSREVNGTVPCCSACQLTVTGSACSTFPLDIITKTVLSSEKWQT